RRVQNDLLDEGADLSVPPPSAEAPAVGVRPRLRVDAAYTEWLERACDEINAKLEPLRSFVIPGGTPAASQLHVCRTVWRRDERRAQRERQRGRRVPAGPRGWADVHRARARVRVSQERLEHVSGERRERDHEPDRQRLAPVTAREREEHQRQAPEGEWQRA